MNGLLILITTAFVALLFLLFVESSQESTRRPVDMQMIQAMEYAYFNGQKDAVNGEIHIIAVPGTDSCYRWLSSPWETGEQTIYTPDCRADKQYFR